MRRIALQSAIVGMSVSILGMIEAATGHLPALEGAILQALIDLAAVINAVRVALPTKDLADMNQPRSYSDARRRQLLSGPAPPRSDSKSSWHFLSTQ